MVRSGGSQAKSSRSDIRDGTVTLRLSPTDRYAEQKRKEGLEAWATRELYAALQEQGRETLALLGIPPGPIGPWYEPPAILLDTSRDPSRRLPVPISLRVNTIDVDGLLSSMDEMAAKANDPNGDYASYDAWDKFKSTWHEEYAVAQNLISAGQPLTPVQELSVTVVKKIESMKAAKVLADPNASAGALSWAKDTQAAWKSHYTLVMGSKVVGTLPVSAGTPLAPISAPSAVDHLNKIFYSRQDSVKAWVDTFQAALDETDGDATKAAHLIAEVVDLPNDEALSALKGYLGMAAQNPPSPGQAPYISGWIEDLKHVRPTAGPAIVPVKGLNEIAAAFKSHGGGDKGWYHAYKQALVENGNDPQMAIKALAQYHGFSDDATAAIVQAKLVEAAGANSSLPKSSKGSAATYLDKLTASLAPAPAAKPLPLSALKELANVTAAGSFPSENAHLIHIYNALNFTFDNTTKDMDEAVQMVAANLNLHPDVVKGAVFDYYATFGSSENLAASETAKFLGGDGVQTISKAEAKQYAAAYYSAKAQAPSVAPTAQLTAADKAAKYGATAAPAPTPAPQAATPTTTAPKAGTTAGKGQLPALGQQAREYAAGAAKATDPTTYADMAAEAWMRAIEDGHDPAVALAMVAKHMKVDEAGLKSYIGDSLNASANDDFYFEFEKEKFAKHATILADVKPGAVAMATPPAPTPLAPKAQAWVDKHASYSSDAGKNQALYSAYKHELAAGTNATDALEKVSQAAGVSSGDVAKAIGTHAKKITPAGGYEDKEVKEAANLASSSASAAGAIAVLGSTKPAAPVAHGAATAKAAAIIQKAGTSPSQVEQGLAYAYVDMMADGMTHEDAMLTLQAATGKKAGDLAHPLGSGLETLAIDANSDEEYTALHDMAVKAMKQPAGPVMPPAPTLKPSKAVAENIALAKQMTSQAGKGSLMGDAFTVAYQETGDAGMALKLVAQEMGMTDVDVKAAIQQHFTNLTDPSMSPTSQEKGLAGLKAISQYTPTGSSVAIPSQGVAQTLDHILVDATQLGIQNGVELFESVNVGVNWQLANTYAQQHAKNYAYGLVADLNATTTAKLQTVISKWVADGKPLKDLQAEIMAEGAGIWDARRAELIAVTEVTRAYEMGSLTIYNQVDGVEGIEWATSMDEHVCRICEPMDKEKGDLQGKYANGMRIPAHPGCRCWSRPIVRMPEKPAVPAKPVAPPAPPKPTSGEPDVDKDAHAALDALAAGDLDAYYRHLEAAYSKAQPHANYYKSAAIDLVAKATGKPDAEIKEDLILHYGAMLIDEDTTMAGMHHAQVSLFALKAPKPQPTGVKAIDDAAYGAFDAMYYGGTTKAQAGLVTAYKAGLKEYGFNDASVSVEAVAKASGLAPEYVKASLTEHYSSIVFNPASKGYAVTDAKAQLNKLQGTNKPKAAPTKKKKAATTPAPAAAPAKPKGINDLPALDPIALKYSDPHSLEPTWAEGKGKPYMANRYGGVMFDDQGRILIREPKGHYDGYVWTFPKGGMDSDKDNPYDAALREVAEETGHQGEVVGILPGGFKSSSSTAAYFYMMRSKGYDASLQDNETESTKFVSYDEAKAHIMLSTNVKGRERDLKILDAAFAHYTGVMAGTVPPAPPLPVMKIDKSGDNVMQQKPDGSWVNVAKTKPAVTATKKKSASTGYGYGSAGYSSTPKSYTAPTSGPVLKDAPFPVQPPPLPARPPLPKGLKPNKPMNVADFPASTSGLEVVKSLGGSTGAKLVRDPATGKMYVYKKGNSADHVRSEAFSDAAYHAMGVPVPRLRLYEEKGGPVKLSEFIEGKTLQELQGSDPKAYKKAVREAQKYFAADALMGNWDVAGMSMDNILVGKDGTVYRIDNGGSLSYRAQGTAKQGLEWAAGPVELFTMRSKSPYSHGPLAGKGPNAGAQAVFGDMDLDAAMESAWQIVGDPAMRQALVDAVPGADGAMLAQRWDNMREMATAHQRLTTDKWKPGYIEGFTYHYAGLASQGAFDKLPEFMVQSGKDTQPVDPNGKPFDDLRGSQSLIYAFEKHVKLHGGDLREYYNWADSQAGDSWADHAQAGKVYFTNQRDVDKDEYWWKHGYASSQKYYKKFIAGKETTYDATMQPLHAMTYAILTRVHLGNQDFDNGYVRLIRTERSSMLRDTYGLTMGETRTFTHGAAESCSLYRDVYIHADTPTIQWIPAERVLAGYLYERQAGRGDRVFLGDGENEMLTMLQGYPTTWTGKK